MHRRDELRPKILQKRAFEKSKISFLWYKVVQEILGKEKVWEVRLKI